MRGCKRLKNINSVSGKLGERHSDPSEPLAFAPKAANQIEEIGRSPGYFLAGVDGFGARLAVWPARPGPPACRQL